MPAPTPSNPPTPLPQALSARVEARREEAASNVKFMGLLREPCEALAEASPASLLELLPELLRRIRVIWCVRMGLRVPGRVRRWEGGSKRTQVASE